MVDKISVFHLITILLARLTEIYSYIHCTVMHTCPHTWISKREQEKKGEDNNNKGGVRKEDGKEKDEEEE